MKQQPSMCSPFILMLSGQKYNDVPYSFGQGRIKYMICTYRDRGAVSVGAHLGQTNDQYFIWIEKEVHYCGPGPLRPAHNASPVYIHYKNKRILEYPLGFLQIENCGGTPIMWCFFGLQGNPPNSLQNLSISSRQLQSYGCCFQPKEVQCSQEISSIL